MSESARPLNELLRFAIANRRLLQFRYKGIVRVAEPHDYGVHNGSEKLLVYQLRGIVRAPGRSAVGWRWVVVSDIEECTVLADTFPGSRGHAHDKHTRWDVVYCRVK